MKRTLIFLCLTLTLLTGCGQMTPQESKNIMSTKTPAPTWEATPTPDPTPEPVASETWQEAYIELLNGYESRRAGFALDIQGICEESYTLYDIDKDGLPELFLIEGFSESSRVCHVYFWQDGFAVEAGGHQEGYIEGALDFWHGSLSTCPGENGVLWSRGYGYNKVRLVDGDLVGASLDGTLPKDLSTDEITAELFVPDTEGLCYYEPSDIQPILDYGLLLAPWQEAYRDILLHPEEYEGFYAVAEHIPSKNSWRLEGIVEDSLPYYFSLADLNRDGIPELLLGLGIQYRAPQVLLNILCWNAETGAAEDMDGPRTYPLMDTLGFFDTGYFITINGAGGLYTEFWHLEDEDPDHYWYGYERSATFNDDGELESWMEFPFGDTNGEQFTLREYYELLGETGPTVRWQEATSENIEKAFLPVTGEEEP